MTNRTLSNNPRENGISTYVTVKYNILIVCEDSKHGMNFHYSALCNLYQDLPFTMISAHGYSGFEGVMDNIHNFDKYDRIIIIFDSGADIKAVKSIKTQLKNIREKHPEIVGKTFLFRPYAFEEELFSFIKLDKMLGIGFDKPGFLEFDNLRNCNIYGRDVYELYRDLEADYYTVERAFEKLLSKITEGTTYRYSHGGSMGECWKHDCCYRDFKLDCNYLPVAEPYFSKADVIARGSVLFGLTLMIDSLLGYKFRLNEISREAIYRCIDKL